MAFEFSKAGPCQCGWLEQESADPEVPISFDEKLNEYNLTYVGSDGPNKLLLRYCPFCGGAAPKSRREELFAELTHSELVRLNKMTSKLETISDVIAALGAPDRDLMRSDGTGGRTPGGAPTFEMCRTLVYLRLSEAADVRVLEKSDGTVRFTFIGKQIATVADLAGDDERGRD